MVFALFGFASQVQAARLYFSPASKEVEKNQELAVELWLDTQGKNVSGVDVYLDYQSSGLSISQASFGSLFDITAFNNSGDSQGRTYLAVAFSSLSGSFKGNQRLATLSLRAKSQAGAYTLRMVCQPGSTNETSIYQTGSWNDVVSCGSLGNFSLTVKGTPTPSPSPSPQPSPSPSPLPSPSPSPAGSSATSSSGAGGPVNPVGCQDASPTRPTGVTAATGPGRGQVTLRWKAVAGADYYTVTYGTGWLNFQYGAPNIGRTTQFVVSGLKPGVVYYFVLTAVRGCASSGYSDGVSATAAGGSPAPAPLPVAYVPTPSPTAALVPSPSPEAGRESGFGSLLTDEDSSGGTPTIKDEGAVTTPVPVATRAVGTEAKEPKPWQTLDFWLLAFGIALGGLFLIFVGKVIGRSCEKIDAITLAAGKAQSG